MVAALSVKTSEINHIARANAGIMGGPVVLAALQASMEQSAVDVVLGTGDPAMVATKSSAEAAALDLSTGTLDGTHDLPANSASAKENGSSAAEEAPKTDKKKAAKASSEPDSKSASEAKSKPVPKPAAKKSTGRYFIQPASGKNWGVLHGRNGVDIANSCGTPVVASAAGVVVSDPGIGTGASGWNSGWGTFVLIKHPNGTKTRYAHLSKRSVAVGERVEQGQQIGKIGNTGKVKGSTGCHLHFEVLGAPNPLAR